MRIFITRPLEKNRSRAAYTLAEMMTGSAVFLLAVVGFVYCQMFGMRQDELTNSKIGATEEARMSFNDLANDIRAAKIWEIGTGNATSFTAIPQGTNQQGNAIRLSMTTDTNSYYVYYFDTNACKLWRGHSGGSNSTLLCQYLTNTMYFKAENYHGDTQTNLTHKGVIDVMMQIAQYQYPITKIGSNCYYDYYKLQLRITPHAPDGP